MKAPSQPIPLSVLMDAAEKYARSQNLAPIFHRNLTLFYATEIDRKLWIPSAYEFWFHSKNFYEEIDEEQPIEFGTFWQIPQDIKDQLIGKEAKAGLSIEYKGETFLVFSLSWNDDKDENIGQPIPNIVNLVLVRPQYIDLTS